MITDITEYIKDWILTWDDLSGDCLITKDPGITYKDGITLAYKDPIKGILTKTSEEFTYSGIDDRKGNFFYIRHVDAEELTYNPIEERITSCLKSTQIIANLRLVSVVKNLVQVNGNEKYEVEEFLRNALLNLDFKDYTGNEKNIEIELTLSRVNSVQVLAEERVEDTKPRGVELKNVFTAIDFILRFNFNNERKGRKLAVDPVDCCNFFLPSKDELNKMYDNLHAEGVGGFGNIAYHSSTEVSAGWFVAQHFATGIPSNYGKVSNNHSRACRSFIADVFAYSLRNVGPCGGLIFYINDAGTTYYEAAPKDSAVNVWSNIVAAEIGTTSAAIGTGQANTNAIIGQAGHTDSSAKLANDLCT